MARTKRAKAIREPRQIERRYAAELAAAVRDIARHIRETVLPALPSMTAQATPARVDTWDDDLEALINAARVFGVRRMARVLTTLDDKAGGIVRFNRQSLINAIGVDPFRRGTDGQWLTSAMGSWAKENANLIESLPDQMITQIEGIAQRGVRGGQNPRDITKEIIERFGVAEKRARFIARDQVAKLNGQITKARNEALGIDMYDWSTSGDERVRESHRVMSGMTCRWDDPSVYSDDGGQTWQSRSSIGGVSEHPGQDYQCFPGSTEINGLPRFDKMYRRFYSGKLCEIVFSDGVVVSATPNHPILTRDGIKPINLIRKGDHVVRHMNEAFHAVELNGKRLIPTFDQIFDAVHGLGVGIAVSGDHAGQFHGDGSDGKVEVIKLDRLLVGEVYVSVCEKMAKLDFTKSDMMICHALLTGLGHGDLLRGRSGYASDSLMRRVNLIGALVVSHLRPFERFCFALCSDINASANKPSANDAAINAKSLGNRVLAFSGLIHGDDFINWQVNNFLLWGVNNNLFADSLDALGKRVWVDANLDTDCGHRQSGFIQSDCVVDCLDRDFSGHVFNLQTDTGYYHANTVAASNCRCVSIPRIPAEFEVET